MYQSYISQILRSKREMYNLLPLKKILNFKKKIDFCFGQTEKNVRNLGFEVLFYIEIESTSGGRMVVFPPF